MTEITGTFEIAPDLPYANRAVRAVVTNDAGARIAATIDGEPVDAVTGTTDDSGAVTLDLPPTDTIDQDDARWKVGIVGVPDKDRVLEVTGPGDFDASDVNNPGRWRPFVPELRDQGGQLDYTLATEADFGTRYYGKPPFGRWRTNANGDIEERGRVITGSHFGTFNKGSGFYYIPLQRPVAPWVTGPIGHGQFSLPDSNHFATVRYEIDPVIDMAAGLASPGELANVAWIFLDGDHNPNTTAMVVGAANPAAPTELMIAAWHMEYPPA